MMGWVSKRRGCSGGFFIVVGGFVDAGDFDFCVFVLLCAD